MNVIDNYLPCWAPDMPFGLLSTDAASALLPATSEQDAVRRSFVPIVIFTSTSLPYCRLLHSMGVTEDDAEPSHFTALDQNVATVMSMIRDGPTAARWAVLGRLRELSCEPWMINSSAALRAPPDAFLDALAAVLRIRGAPAEPPPILHSPYFTPQPDQWATLMASTNMMHGVSGNVALSAAGALCVTHAMLLITPLLPLPPPGVPFAPARALQLHRRATRLLDAGAGEEVLCWASSQMYPAEAALPCADHPGVFRGPPLPPGAAVVCDETVAGRTRPAALLLAARLLVHGVLYDEASRERHAPFAAAIVRIAAASMATVPRESYAAVRLRSAASLCLQAATCAPPGAASLLMRRLRADALLHDVLRHAELLTELRFVPFLARCCAHTLCGTLALAAPDADVAANYTAVLATKLAEAAQAAPRFGWPLEPDEALLQSVLAALKMMASVTEFRGAPCFSAQARAHLSSLRPRLLAADSPLAAYPAQIAACLAAPPTVSLADTNGEVFRERSAAIRGTTPASAAPARARVCAGCGSSGAPKLRQCRGCSSTLYCGEACQRAAWPGHKAACKAMAAAAAASSS